MASPLSALSKPYCTRRDIPFPAEVTQSDIRRSAIFLLKESMVDNTATGTFSGNARTATNKWTVYYSCGLNGGGPIAAGGAGDGIDRWQVYSDVVQNTSGSNHSWIVLYSATLGLYCVIDANSTTNNIRMSFTKTAPTGGSTVTGPTTTNAWVVGSSSADSTGTTQAFIGDDVVAATHYANFTISDDGKQFYFMLMRNGTNLCSSFTAFNMSVGYDVSDTHPYFTTRHTSISGRGAPTYTVVSGSTGFTSRSYDNSNVTSQGGATGFVYGGTAWPDGYTTDALTGNYPTAPIAVGALSPGPVNRGTIPDLYYVGAANPMTGITVSGVLQYLVCAGVAVPFVGAVPIS